MGLLTALLVALPTAAAPSEGSCLQTVTNRELNESIRSAEEAFSDLDAERFEVASERMQAQLPCARESLSPSLAAAFHRAEGLSWVMARDGARAELAFAAARAIDPGFRYPDDFVPPGSPVYENYFALGVATWTAEPVPPPAWGKLYTDGLPAVERPRSWPTIFQHVADNGTVRDTWYLWPDDPLPRYPMLEDRSRRRRRVLAVAGGLVAAGLGLFGGAVATRSVYDDPTTPYQDLDALRSRILALTIAAGATATVGVGLGAWAIAPKKHDAPGSRTGDRPLPRDSSHR